MRMDVRTVPLELRADAARNLIAAGEDALLTLSYAIWPHAAPVFDTDPTIEVMEFCKNGHPWDAENTFTRPQGWRKCRACERELKRNRPSTKLRRVKRKVPCSYCGQPACAPGDNKGARPRCRACFLAQKKAGTL